MEETKEIYNYKEMSKFDFKDKVSKKMGFNYISWADAWDQLKLMHPTASRKVYETTDGRPYFDDGKTWVNTSSMSLPSGSYYLRIKIGADCPSEKVLAVINAPSDAPKPPKYTVSQPLSCTNAFGNITITDSAAEYSFDD